MITMAIGSVIWAVAKWALGIGATVVATDLLNENYQKNKNQIGKTFSEYWKDFVKYYEEYREENFGSPKIELLDKPTSENTSVSPSIGDKEQTNGMQGSMDYSEFNKWLESEEGRKFLNETAPRLRAEGIAGGNIEVNPGKQEQIDSIQGNYDEGTYLEHYDSYLKAVNNLTAKPGDFEFTEDETVGEILPKPGDTNDDEKKEEFENPYQPDQGITDKTDENLGTNNIGAINWLEWAEQEQAKRWARDDAIMKATWEREDTAWQRSVEDMKKAGVNPNLINAQPAASGGGITQSSGQNLSGVTSQLNIDAEKLQQMIDQAFKGNENDKDRFIETFGSIIQWIAILSALKK